MNKPSLNTKLPKPTRYIDMTPTWSAILPIYCAVLSNPDASFEGHKSATEELERMAKLADKWVAHCKDQTSVVTEGM